VHGIEWSGLRIWLSEIRGWIKEKWVCCSESYKKVYGIMSSLNKTGPWKSVLL
jgi:hypothetical protein